MSRILPLAFSLLILSVSGVTAQSPALRGVDFPGGDIRGIDIAAGDWATCQRLCEGERLCIGWTLYSPPGAAKGGCWLKSVLGQSTANPDTISGLMARRK